MNRRFTSRDALGIWVKGYANNDETATHFPYYEDELYEAVEKLAHYEDLEEQGRLIELQQGQWIPFKLDTRGYVEIIHYECSNCHNVRGGQTMYCPNCGAKMGDEQMRIDLPQCGLDSCRYSFDGNCTNEQRYKTCEFAYFKQLEADGRLIVLPCKVGDTVYIPMQIRDNYTDLPRTVIAQACFKLADINRIGKTVFLTKEEAEVKLAELGGKA